MSAIQLMAQLIVLVVALSVRLAQGKLDKKTAEVALALSLCLLAIWIKAFVGLTHAAYATYGAGKALRGWWEENHAQPQAEVAAQALQVAQVTQVTQVEAEVELLEGFQPFGYLPEAKEITIQALAQQTQAQVQVEVEKKVFAAFTPVGLLPPAVEQVEQQAVVSSPASGLEGSLEGLTVKQLKEVAKNRGLKGYSRLKKAELLKLLN